MTTTEIVLMLIKSIPALLLVFLVWPLGLGAGLGLKKNIDRYIIGFAAVQATFFLCYIPAILNSWSSRTLTAVGAITISLLAIGGAAIRFAKSNEKNDFLVLKSPNLQYLKNPFFLGSLVIIVYELYIYVFKEPWIYGDDVTYIRLITDFVDTNTIYVKTWIGQDKILSLTDIDYKYLFTSYYPYLGMVSLVTGLHPLILCKTVIPVFYIPIHYLIVWRIGVYLFDKDTEKLSLFFLFYSVLIEFGQISYYALSRRVTIWIYNSKSNCFCLLLIPLFFYTYLLLNGEQKIAPTKLWLRLVIIGVIALACNSSSLMGIIMSAMVIGVWSVICAFRSKKVSLLFYSMLTLVPHAITAMLIVGFIG